MPKKLTAKTRKLLDTKLLIGRLKPKESNSYNYTKVLLPRWQEQQKLAKLWLGVGLIAVAKEDPAYYAELTAKNSPLWRPSIGNPLSLMRRARAEMNKGWRVGMAVGPSDRREP